MAPLLYLLLMLSVCNIIYCKPIKAIDFRPNTTYTHARVHKDCQAAYNGGWKQSGVYTISPYGKPIDVFCEQSLDDGWIVFQTRINGDVNFFRSWHDYKVGFGDPFREYWLGNDELSHLTSHHDYMLRVEVEYGDERAWSEYAEFWIDSENNKYKLHVDYFSHSKSTAGDSFHDDDASLVHDGQYFSTKDIDNDNDNDNSGGDSCAVTNNGAWWYNWCLESNLNGAYNIGPGKYGVVWLSWKGGQPLTGARMMIKKR